jgi:hypothetical protein
MGLDVVGVQGCTGLEKDRGIWWCVSYWDYEYLVFVPS